MKFNRDQVVAASLVGTVVVVLGFASGLGRAPTVAADRPSTAHPPSDHVTGTTDPAPAVHVGQPQRNQGTAVPHPDPVHPRPSHPDPSHPEPAHPGDDPHPTTPPTTTTPPTAPPTRPPCDVDAIGALLAGLGALVDGLPLVPDLTGALPPLADGVALDAVTGVLWPIHGLLGGAPPTPLTGPLAGVLPTGAPGGLPPRAGRGGGGG
ncbi:hypothetical protein, partial [Saccharothrix luteola]|uniref:hypothetical protein n=1 Tax=Saccharothrix luteola TaxID=2893018 RepID=UPI001E40B4EF